MKATKTVVPPVEPETTITLTITMDEARDLRNVCDLAGTVTDAVKAFDSQGGLSTVPTRTAAQLKVTLSDMNRALGEADVPRCDHPS